MPESSQVIVQTDQVDCSIQCRGIASVRISSFFRGKTSVDSNGSTLNINLLHFNARSLYLAKFDTLKLNALCALPKLGWTIMLPAVKFIYLDSIL